MMLDLVSVGFFWFASFCIHYVQLKSRKALPDESTWIQHMAACLPWEWSEWPPNVLTWLRWFAARLPSRTMMKEDNIQCSWQHTVHNRFSFWAPFFCGKALIVWFFLILLGAWEVRNWSFTNYELVMIVSDHSIILRHINIKLYKPRKSEKTNLKAMMPVCWMNIK